MSYTLTKSDGTILLTLGVGKVDNVSTSLTLIGKNVEPYGEYYNNSLIWLLENFASESPPHSPIIGQLWYNTLDDILYVYDTYNEFVPVGGGGSPAAPTPTATPTVVGTMFGYTPETSESSIILGHCAGNVTMTGLNNIAIGHYSLTHNDAGCYNIAIGQCTLTCSTCANLNIGIGFGTLCKTLMGSCNVAIGICTLTAQICGCSNVALGEYAAFGQVAGCYNVAIGCNAMYSYGDGAAFVAYGSHGRTATNNVAIGVCSLYNITHGQNNVAIGYAALAHNKYGKDNIGIGCNAGYSNCKACNNISLGLCANYYGAMGNNNISIGTLSNGYGSSYGANSIAIGTEALYNGGCDSIAIGTCASQGGSNFSVAIGTGALKCNKASYNVAIGLNSQQNGLCSFANTSIGFCSLNQNLCGCNNTAVGHEALTTSNPSCNNTAIGACSQLSGATCCNASLGACSLVNNSGHCNVAVGTAAGYTNTTGCNNVFLGHCALGVTATTSNMITLGNSAHTTIRGQATSITALSDCRDKTNITGIPIGLDFIKEVNPVQFTWNMRDGGKVGIPEMGFIAQELDALQQKYNVKDALNLVLDENPDKLEATPGKLLPVVIKALQDLSLENDRLKASQSRVQVVTTAERDALPATNGELAYNSDTNKFQGFANGAWVDIS